MHRHGYQGRKFGREIGPRKALIKGLAEALIIHESIETTHMKAKEIVPYVERLITKAKKGDLHARRQIIASLHTLEAAHKLVDEIAPKLTARSSGHLRVVRTTMRRGDNTQLARVSFVDDLKVAPAAQPAARSKQQEASKAAAAPKPKTTAKVTKKATPAKEKA